MFNFSKKDILWFFIFFVLSFIITFFFVLDFSVLDKGNSNNNIVKNQEKKVQKTKAIGADIIEINRDKNFLVVKVYVDNDDDIEEEDELEQKENDNISLMRRIILTNQTKILETIYPNDYYEGKSYSRKEFQRDISILKPGDSIGIVYFGDWKSQDTLTAEEILVTNGVDKEEFDAM